MINQIPIEIQFEKSLINSYLYKIKFPEIIIK